MPVNMDVVREFVEQSGVGVDAAGLALAYLTIDEREEIRENLTPAEIADGHWAEVLNRMDTADLAELNADMQQFFEDAFNAPNVQEQTIEQMAENSTRLQQEQEVREEEKEEKEEEEKEREEEQKREEEGHGH